MIEFFLTVLTTYVLSIWGITVLFILALLWEYNDWYLSTLIGALAVYTIAHYNGYILSVFSWWHGLAYIVVGIMWSFWRYKKFVEEYRKSFQEKLDRDAKNYPNSYRKGADDVLSDFRYNAGVVHNTDKICSWILIWPISFLENMLDDVITFVHKIIKEYLIKVYNHFLAVEASKLDLGDWAKREEDDGK